jgi:MFS transporter, UMF1 family
MSIESPSFPIDDKRIINGWAMFDWANSAFALVITTAIFPGYLEAILPDEFLFLGFTMKNSAILGFSISFAYLIIALCLPLLTGIADYGGKKMPFMKFFTRMGGLSCLALFFFVSPETMWIGLTGFILGVIGFAGGQVFYNSYLPDIVSEAKYDNVSAKGFAYGYIGSVLLLIFNLIMLTFPNAFGFDKLIGVAAIFGDDPGALAARLSFIMVGIWWIGFSQITFNRLPVANGVKLSSDILVKGYQEIKKVWHELKTQIHAKRFLIAFFCYSAGAQTAIFLASIFAIKELKFETSELIIVVLILQIVAIGGAYLAATLSTKYGNKKVLIVILLIWTAICITGFFVQGKINFYILAGFVGLVMGGVQSLSRSTYSKLIPENTKDTASYFSFFDVLEKVAIALGTLTFSLLDQQSGMRASILGLAVFFIIGIVILTTVRSERLAPKG